MKIPAVLMAALAMLLSAAAGAQSSYAAEKQRKEREKAEQESLARAPPRPRQDANIKRLFPRRRLLTCGGFFRPQSPE